MPPIVRSVGEEIEGYEPPAREWVEPFTRTVRRSRG